MTQEELFGELPTTTAITPNRKRDKLEVESKKGIQEHGNQTTVFLTPAGNLFATGYNRIVYGDHGPYVEFEKSHVKMGLLPKFPGKVLPEHCYYEWLLPQDRSSMKIYDQKRDVKNLKNPPTGGTRNNRKDGYADYLPGKIYVSPWDLKTKP